MSADSDRAKQMALNAFSLTLELYGALCRLNCADEADRREKMERALREMFSSALDEAIK